MSNLSLILLVSIFAIASANAEIPNPPGCPQSEGSSRDSAGGVMTLVDCPARPKSLPTKKDNDEAQRKTADVPKSTWDKMTNAEKAGAVEKQNRRAPPTEK